MIHKNEATTRTWEVNADEFGAITRGVGGWPLAQLVACSVEKDTNLGGHRPKGSTVTPVTVPNGKTGVNEFAKRAGVSAMTISRYLEGWAKAVENGAPVPPADELSPSDVGAFPLPPRPFNGPGGYVSTKNLGNGGAQTQVDNIVKGGTLTTTIAKSPGAMKALIEAAAKGPSKKVLSEVLLEIDDDTFEELNDAIVAITTPTPAVVTDTGVKPAYTPPAAKVKTAEKAAGKIHEAKVQKKIQELIASSPPKTLPKAQDGGKSPNQLLLEKLHAADALWDTEGVIHFLDKVFEAVLAYPGELEDSSEEFLEERLGIIKSKIARIETAIEAKKGSKVPDTLPEGW